MCSAPMNDLFRGIHIIQLVIQTAFGHQFLMGTLFFHSLVGKHPDDIRVADGGNAVRGDRGEQNVFGSSHAGKPERNIAAV